MNRRLLFLFILGLFIIAGTVSASCPSWCYVPQAGSPQGTLSVSKTNVSVGESFNVTITAQNSSQVCLNGSCKSGNSGTWSITKNSPGTYNFCGQVSGYGYSQAFVNFWWSEDECYHECCEDEEEDDYEEDCLDEFHGDTSRHTITANTSPNCVTVTVEQDQPPVSDFFCYNNDVYRENDGGFWSPDREKIEECGSDSWTNNYRCSGDTVQREKTERGCENASCYERDVWEDHETCGYNETCRNGECVRDEDDLRVSCYASPSHAERGERITFRSDVSGGTGYYSYYWTGDCRSYSSSCSERYYNAGTQRATLTVESGNQTESATCSAYIEEEEEDYLSCWNGDVYWYDEYGRRESKYRECGSDYCESWDDNYCSGGDVYRKRTCYNKGCSDDSCYSSSYTDRDLVERCDSDETCDDGECVKECECSSGPCCDGCHYKSSGTTCNVDTQTQYSCPWGTSCGSDVGKRTRSRFQYCSGESSSCSGNWSSWTDWGNWRVADSCSASEVCRTGSSVCHYSSNCVYSPPSYYKYYARRCYQGDLYWYDSNNRRQEVYQSCSDGNECTLDSCENNVCVNELKCDGSACEIGSRDYCENCEHCGDEVCNCEEDKCTCPEDCSSIIISAFGKASNSVDWETSLAIAEGEKELNFLVVLANSGFDTAEDVFVEAELPSGLSYKGNLKMDGASITGNITKGIAVDSIEVDAAKTITFKAEIADKEGGEKEVLVKAEIKGLYSTDTVKLNLGEKGERSVAAAGSFLSFLTERWYIWLLAAIAIFSIIWILRKGS